MMETLEKVKEDWEGGDDEDVVCLWTKSSKKSPTSLIDHLIKTSQRTNRLKGVELRILHKNRFNTLIK